MNANEQFWGAFYLALHREAEYLRQLMNAITSENHSDQSSIDVKQNHPKNVEVESIEESN